MLSINQDEIEALLDECRKKLEQLTGVKVFVDCKFSFSDAASNNLQCIIADACGVQWLRVISKNRRRELVIPRQLYCWFAAKLLRKKKVAIAADLGKHHTTVIVSIKKIEGLLYVRDEATTTMVDTIKKKLNEQKDKAAPEQIAVGAAGGTA